MAQGIDEGPGLYQPKRRHKQHRTPGPRRPPRQIGPSQYIHFYIENFYTPSDNVSFNVLCGDQPPTITAGRAKWGVVDRPLRRGLTIFQGYDPTTMQLSVRFSKFAEDGSWEIDHHAALTNETDIQALEWGAGQYTDSGPSSFVYVSTFDGGGNAIPLIPFEYQAPTPSTPRVLGGNTAPWIVTDLTWDANPLRNKGGYRIRQDATLTLQQYLGIIKKGTAAGIPSRGRSRPKAHTVVSRPGVDTPLLIARHQAGGDPESLANQIIADPHNHHLHLRKGHVRQKIKHGKKVWVPAG